ncbi:lon protease homolog 1, mitochondrial-like [Rutidosis leptorrhynchoides]|uniref:lon protease homolog 1, mitochondrial-like n=1 Tax=Rutidosis leptorrhynchoides TaxID=125765 RepID=UPI003A9964AE
MDRVRSVLPRLRKPRVFTKVLALPLPHRPLFPGCCIPIYVKDSKLLAAMVEKQKQQSPYVGAFLVKDDPRSKVTSSDIYERKGEGLSNRLHEIGTLARITRIQGDQVVLTGHRRLVLQTPTHTYKPLKIPVMPMWINSRFYLLNTLDDKYDDVIKATSFEVLSTLRDVMKTRTLWTGDIETYNKHIGDFNSPRLADFAAAISYSDKRQCQQVLEESDVYKRLRLSLGLLKNQMEIHKIQEVIATSTEEKELGLKIDDKTALIDKFWVRIYANKEKMSSQALQVMEGEVKKLQQFEASSVEFIVTRKYLEKYLDGLDVLPPFCS